MFAKGFGLIAVTFLLLPGHPVVIDSTAFLRP